MGKLTQEQAAEIRNSSEPAKQLAEQYGVSLGYIYAIRNGNYQNPEGNKPFRSRPHDPNVPYGYCQCNCGRKAPLAKQTDTSRGNIKGEPQRFVRGHGATGRPRTRYQRECRCGCGTLTWETWAPGHMMRTEEGAYNKSFLKRAEVLPPDEWAEQMLGNTKVEDRGYETACWIWQGNVNGTTGYPTARYDGRTTTIHRRLWEISHGLEFNDPRMHVHHKCEQIDCLNPDHHEAMTMGDNLRASKKVTPLTEDDVREIRRLRAEGVSVHEIGPRFGIKPGSVYNIVSRVNWSHVN